MNSNSLNSIERATPSNLELANARGAFWLGVPSFRLPTNRQKCEELIPNELDAVDEPDSNHSWLTGTSAAIHYIGFRADHVTL